jgi:DNA-dependent RNA polymerase auxiliary subunit epsilon
MKKYKITYQKEKFGKKQQPQTTSLYLNSSPTFNAKDEMQKELSPNEKIKIIKIEEE